MYYFGSVTASFMEAFEVAVISQVRLQKFLLQGDLATDKSAKGSFLEDAVAYSFGKLPGVTVIGRNVRDVHGVREIDVCFRNLSKYSGLDFLHWFMIIECKNWASKVGYQDVVAFKDMLRTRNCPNGILVAANGVAGGQGKDAWSAIEDAHKQQVSILVLTGLDLKSLKSSDDLKAMLEERMLHLVLNGTHSHVR